MEDVLVSIGSLWDQVQLADTLTEMVEGVSAQIGDLLPIGITLMFALAVPRIVKKLVHTFL